MIFFDLDDTLLDHSQAQRLAALAWYREMGPGSVPHSEDTFPAVWHAGAVRNWAAFERGEISFAEQRRRRIRDALREPQLPDERADMYFERYLPLYQANWQLFEDVLPVLELLEGQRLAVLTHGDADQQNRKLASLGLSSKFEMVIVLGEGSRPESPLDAFKMAAQRAQVRDTDCVYIGENLQNGVLNACLAGWRAVWLERSMTLLAPDGVERVTSLRDVPRLLQI